MTQPSLEHKVLAVGTPGGITSGFPGLPDGGGLVRLGPGLLSLDEDDYKLWDASQLAPAAGPLLEQAAQDGVADPAAVLAGLAAARLVMSYADEPEPVRNVAAGLSVRLTGRLIGNGPYQSPHFLVAPYGGATPQLRVDVLVYQFLLRADGRTSVAELCATLDTVPPDPGFVVERHVAGWIPALMRAGVIGLDLAEPPGGWPR
jgi:hypothetical protein